MSQQTVSQSEEKSSWASGLAAVIVLAALVLYYTLIDQSLWVRLGVLFGGIAIAVLIKENQKLPKPNRKTRKKKR